MIKSLSKSVLVLRIAAFGISILLRLVMVLMRWEVRDYGGFEHVRSGHAVIFALWHGRLLLTPRLISKRVLRDGSSTAFLASKSRDGQFAVWLASAFGFEAVWGSSSKDSLGGYRDACRRLMSGRHICITPDGPRGPARKVAAGVISIARTSGVAIVPISWSASRMRRADSWDRFAIPRFFSRGVAIYGAPIFIARDTGKDGIAQACLDLEDAMNQITAEADEAFGYPADHAISRYGDEKVKQ